MKIKNCKHTRLKVRKHKINLDPCLHCLDCSATWNSDRGMYYLKKFKYLIGINNYDDVVNIYEKDK